MKLASYSRAGKHGIAVVSADDTQLFDLGSLWPRVLPSWPVAQTMLDVIAAGPALRQALTQALPDILAATDAAVALEAVTLHAPVRRPSKICCLALNNSANSDRILQGPKHPAMFLKPASALIGHGQAIEVRADDGRVHPEPELAVIIGRQGKHIRAEDAYDYVFGYTVHNDVTGATMRGEDTFHYRAIHPGENGQDVRYVDTWTSYPGRYKGSDTFGPMGPWLVTADDVPDPHDLVVSCHHQGRLITEDNTANLTYKIPEVIAYLSRYMTLWPGDIISMGTALKRSDSGGAVQNVDLTRLGGPVSVQIERIGTLGNAVRRLDDRSV